MPAPQISKRAKLERLLGFEPLLLTLRTAADCTSATARLCTCGLLSARLSAELSARLEALSKARLSAMLEELSKARLSATLESLSKARLSATLEALSKAGLSEMAMKLGAMLSAKLEAF